MIDNIRISDIIHKMAYVLFCVYMASISFCYISPLLDSLNSFSLRAFVVVSAVSVVLHGRFVMTGYLKVYGVFTALALISCAYSINVSGSFAKFYDVAVCFIICFCATAVIQSEEQIKTVFLVYSISSCVLMIFLISTGDIDLSGDWIQDERFGGDLTGNANVFANIFMFAACFTAYLIAYSDRAWKKLLFVGAFCLHALALVVSGGRKYILVTALVFWLIYLFKADKRNRKHFFKYTVIGVAVFIFLFWTFMNVPFIYYNVGYRFEALFLENVEDASAYRRAIMIKEGITGWLQRPILGHGINTFKDISIYKVYSHNNYVELLFNMGVVGFLVYYGYSILLTVKLYLSKNTDSIRWLLLMLTVAIFLFDYGAVSYAEPLQQIFLALCSRFLILKDKPSVDVLTERTAAIGASNAGSALPLKKRLG